MGTTGIELQVTDRPLPEEAGLAGVGRCNKSDLCSVTSVSSAIVCLSLYTGKRLEWKDPVPYTVTNERVSAHSFHVNNTLNIISFNSQ